MYRLCLKLTSTVHSFSLDKVLPWIQVDLQTPKLVTGVVTQGRPTSKEEWVQSFQIQYGNSVDNLMTITNNGTETVRF